MLTPAPYKMRFPGATDRIVIVGRTGSGKTVGGLFYLSLADFHVRPWVILDYKGDENIAELNTQSIGYDTVPESPGLYLIRVLPGDKKELSEWFRKVWEKEGIGIFVDEGYMIDPRDQWFQACLTQGRSKEIPMIVLSQRPAWMSRFVWTEASFFQVYDLTDDDDIGRLREFIKARKVDTDLDIRRPLPDYHSYYYDVSKRKLLALSPVPDVEETIDKINARIPRRVRVI